MTEGTVPGTRRTAPREKRWRPLIDAAILSLAQHGLSGTTTAIVTEHAGLSAGIVSLHFGRKENLLVATLDHLAQEHRARWVEAVGEPGLTAAGRLWAIMAAHFDPAICTAPKIATWFAFFGEARYRETYRRSVGSPDLERTTAVEDCCRSLLAECGDARLDPAQRARAIGNFADGLWLDLLLYPDQLTCGQARERMRLMLNARFAGRFDPVAAAAPDGRRG